MEIRYSDFPEAGMRLPDTRLSRLLAQLARRRPPQPDIKLAVQGSETIHVRGTED